MFGFTAVAYFSYDKGRVLEVGPDRVAAEWIVRCEGKVKCVIPLLCLYFLKRFYGYRYCEDGRHLSFRFDKVHTEFNDYNSLIRETSKRDYSNPNNHLYVVSIDATDASITSHGCRHFGELFFLKYFFSGKI